MKRALWLLEAALFIILSISLAILPYRLSIKAGEILGLLLFFAWGSRRKIAIENLRKTIESHALSSSEPAEKVIRQNFKNLGSSLAEVIKIYYGLGKKLVDSVEVEGIENFKRAKSKGRGILFLTGHCGNWELAAVVTSVKLSGVAGVARPINNPYINKFIEKTRQKYGNSVIYKQGALKGIIRKLKENGCVGILMDQAVLREEGYIIDFLGRGAWTTKAPALIARKTGAAVLPIFIHREGKDHRMKVYPEVNLSDIDDSELAVLEDTKRFSSYIEDYIKENPSEWLWIHRRWKRVGGGVSAK